MLKKWSLCLLIVSLCMCGGSSTLTKNESRHIIKVVLMFLDTDTTVLAITKTGEIVDVFKRELTDQIILEEYGKYENWRRFRYHGIWAKHTMVFNFSDSTKLPIEFYVDSTRAFIRYRKKDKYVYKTIPEKLHKMLLGIYNQILIPKGVL